MLADVLSSLFCRYKQGRYPENMEKFIMCNSSPLDADVSFSFLSDVKGETYLLDPPTMQLRPSERQVTSRDISFLCRRLIIFCICERNSCLYTFSQVYFPVVIKLYRMHETGTIAFDVLVVWCVCQSVCKSVAHLNRLDRSRSSLRLDCWGSRNITS